MFCISESPAGAAAERGVGVAVVTAGGELDYAASPRFRECLLGHVRVAGRDLVVDLSEVTFIDSTAIGVLIAAVTRLRESGASLAVVCAAQNERVLRIFDIAGVAGLMSLYSSRTDALAALAATRSAGAAPWMRQTTSAATPASPGRSRPAASRSYAQERAIASERLGAGRRAETGHAVDELA